MLIRRVTGFSGRASKRAGLTLALTVGGLLAVPAIASAATVSQTGATITYQAAVGETNSVVVNDPTATSYTFAETPITAGTGCVQTNANLVTCTNASANISIVMNMDNMGDTVNASGAGQAADTFQINGEAGIDTLTGSAQVDTINGGTEADTMNGDAGADTMNGDTGADTMNGGAGAETMNGDAGNDLMDGEADADGINGGDDADVIYGGTGNTIDTLSGGLGTDTINGGDGNDILNGGDGNDSLVGGRRADDINGDAGNDRLDPGNNQEVSLDDLDGGTGIDRAVFGIIADAAPIPAGANTYTCNDQGLVITMDNVANDSDCSDTAADTVNIRDSVESVTGSSFSSTGTPAGNSDTITGSCLANTFAGSNGTAVGHNDAGDTFNGDPAVCATNGTDFLGGGEGNDSFNCDGTGTAGFDTVTYGTPYTGGAAISITLDDVANDDDGMGNTTDNVQGDCERIIGTANGDTINATGADQAVQLFGRLGGDTLTDGPFDDLLNGEGGTDTANCTNGGTDTAIDIETNNGCEL